MQGHEFIKMIEEIKRTSLKGMYEDIDKEFTERFTEMKERNVPPEQNALILSSHMAAFAASRAILITLAKVYDLEPNPYDPRSYFHIVQPDNQ